MASALASLTANYTDSEGEEDHENRHEESEGEMSRDGLHPSLAERLGKIGKESSPGGSSNSSAGAMKTNSASGKKHWRRSQEDTCE